MKLPGQELAGPAVVDLLLGERLADALHDAAMDLPAHDQRIEHAAEIIDHEIAIDLTSPVSGSTSTSHAARRSGGSAVPG